MLTRLSAVPAQASTSGLYVYPRNGQSTDWQGIEDWQCNRSVVEVTGYDSDNPPRYNPARPDRAAKGRTLSQNGVLGSATVGQAARGAAFGTAGLIRGLYFVFNQSGRHEQRKQIRH